MREWLSIELVLGTLLATSFTWVGLVALWAAKSPRHWFLRFAVVLPVLTPLLLIPAYEPFLVFALEAGVVVAGVRIWCWKHNIGSSGQSVANQSTNNARSWLPQFSLPTLLWLTALTGIVVAVAARIVQGMPLQNSESWTTMLVQGASSGCIVLLAAATLASQRKWLPGVTVAALCLAIGLLLAWRDWFVIGLLGIYLGWPPDTATWPSLGWDYTGAVWWRSAAIWLGTTMAVLVAAGGISLLWAIAFTRVRSADVAGAPRKAGRGVAPCCLAIILLLLAA